MSMINSTPKDSEATEPLSRAALRVARRVCIKAGTSVVANDDGSPSLTRLGAIVEQIAELNHAGIEVIFISSGAVGMGKNLLRKQARLNMSFKDLHNAGAPGLGSVPSAQMTATTSIGNLQTVDEHMETSAAKSYAAAGQFELMNLYQSLLSPKGVTASQMLLTQVDFENEHHLKNLRYAVERQLSLGIVPIINENDAVSVVQTSDDDETPKFTDNDSLAALCARAFGAEVLILLTDVEGVYDMPPSNPKAKLIPFYHQNSSCAIGEKSSQGRGGMSAKINAARGAVREGSACAACVIAAGSDLNAIRSVLSPTYNQGSEPPKGTLFATPGSDLEKLALEAHVDAVEVRTASCLPRLHVVVKPVLFSYVDLTLPFHPCLLLLYY
jgi:delta-1-pyrroline-5-carboxylate synthetase